MGQPWSAAYCASKGGVVMLTKALAEEYLGKLRVNAIAPGGTNTNIINSFSDIPDGGSFNQMHRMMNAMGMCEPSEHRGRVRLRRVGRGQVHDRRDRLDRRRADDLIRQSRGARPASAATSEEYPASAPPRGT